MKFIATRLHSVALPRPYVFFSPLWQSNQSFRRLFANFLHSTIRSRGVSVVVELHFRGNFRYRAKRNVTLVKIVGAFNPAPEFSFGSESSRQTRPSRRARRDAQSRHENTMTRFREKKYKEAWSSRRCIASFARQLERHRQRASVTTSTEARNAGSAVGK